MVEGSFPLFKTIEILQWDHVHVTQRLVNGKLGPTEPSILAERVVGVLTTGFPV